MAGLIANALIDQTTGTRLPQTGTMQGRLEGHATMNVPVPSGSPRPLAPGEFVANPNGSWSNEISTTVSDPKLNHGKPTVIPTLWIVNGKPYHATEDQATEFAIHSGLVFPSFNTEQEADHFANQREKTWQHIQPQNDASIAPLWRAPNNNMGH